MHAAGMSQIRWLFRVPRASPGSAVGFSVSPTFSCSLYDPPLLGETL